MGHAARVGSVELADWVGLPGARAAEGVRSVGFRPAMELVEADGETGVVVAQEPQAGSTVARNCLVTLFVAAPAGRQAEAASAADDGAELDDASPVGEAAEQPDADDGWPPAVEGDGRWRSGPEVALADGPAVDGLASEDLDVAPVGREGIAPVAPAPRVPRPRRPVARVRVRWMLVIGGWRVWWPEALAGGVLALGCAWAVGGGRALAGVIAGAAVTVALAAAAWLAADAHEGRESAGSGRSQGRGEELMVMTTNRQGGGRDGRFE